jgi:hypothetical protein
MRTLILSCGPTLDLFPGGCGQYDAVIGVNGVIAKHPLDWWVMGDDETAEAMIGPLRAGQAKRGFFKRDIPSFTTVSDEVKRLTNRLPHFIWHHTTQYLLPFTIQNSGTAALYLAWMLGSHEVDIWGMNMRGPAGFIGENDPEIRAKTRTDSRWAKEKKQVDGILELYKREGRIATFN